MKVSQTRKKNAHYFVLPIHFLCDFMYNEHEKSPIASYLQQGLGIYDYFFGLFLLGFNLFFGLLCFFLRGRFLARCLGLFFLGLQLFELRL